MTGGNTKNYKYNARLTENASLQDHAFAGYKILQAGESATGSFAGFFVLEEASITATAERGDSLNATPFPQGMYIPFFTRNITCVSGLILVAYYV